MQPIAASVTSIRRGARVLLLPVVVLDGLVVVLHGRGLVDAVRSARVRPCRRPVSKMGVVSVILQTMLICARHCVDGLAEVGRSLEQDLLRQPIRVPWMPRHQFAQPRESVIEAGISKSYNTNQVITEGKVIKIIIYLHV